MLSMVLTHTHSHFYSLHTVHTHTHCIRSVIRSIRIVAYTVVSVVVAFADQGQIVRPQVHHPQSNVGLIFEHQ